MDISRKTFLSSMAGATVTLWLQGCGGGGGGYGSSNNAPAGGVTCGAGAADISNNHGHTLVVLKADLDSTTDKTYNLSQSVDGHTHSVTFTVAQLALLKGGAMVPVTSSTTVASSTYGGTHSHTVTASVASTCA